MKILITGANGQLGQDIQKLCCQNSLDHIPASSGVLDISDMDAVTSYLNSHRVDVIINCAAYNNVDRAEYEWKKAFSVNGLGVRNLAIGANRIGASLVHYSTDFVFDGRSNTPYKISDIPSPISRYGESKQLGEDFVRDLGVRFFLIRTSWLFGSGNDNFLKKIMLWSREKTKLKVVMDQTSSPTYTLDLARATLDLVKKDVYGIYHITNSGHCSRYDWASYLLKQLGWEGDLIAGTSDEFPTPAKRPVFSVLDNFGTLETIGYDLPHWKDATDRFMKEMEWI
jgi:dTDP-4-dehydrorhamnose reductase